MTTATSATALVANGDLGTTPVEQTQVGRGGRASGSAPLASLPYTPGFDGLRGFGLPIMLAYHHGVNGARGGAFTVSMFLTLSGYLIATLMLAEWARNDRVSLRRFWTRRARRLLPAALLTLGFIMVLQFFAEVGSGDRFQGDLFGAIGYVANWRFAFSGGDYADLFQIKSPVQHFWSLAVEEQFYLLFPLLFIGLTALARRRWQIVGVAIGALAAASFLAAWLTVAADGKNTGLAYYATYTRASEILLGATLAFVVATRPVHRFLTGATGVQVVRIAGLVAFAAMTWMWLTVSITDPFLFRGGTLVHGLLVCVVLLACASARPGVLARFLSIRPLADLGKIAYGVYLFHWPIYLWLDHHRLDLPFWRLFVLRVSVTLVVAIASYHLIEWRFRRGPTLTPRRLTTVVAAPVAAVVALVMLIPVHPSQIPKLPKEFGKARLTTDFVVPDEHATSETRVLVVGDSISWTLVFSLQSWNEGEETDQVRVDSYAAGGCGLGEPAPVRWVGEVDEPTRACRSYHDGMDDVLRENDYDVILLSMGHRDLGDRQMPDGEWAHIGQPAYDEWLRGEIGKVADVLSTEGVPVLWSTAPHMRMVKRDDPPGKWSDYSENEPERADRLNELFEAELATRPLVSLVPVDEWLAEAPGGVFDTDYRYDGVHFSLDGAEAISLWLTPQLIEAARSAQNGPVTDAASMSSR